jgi:alpha-N-arabinofuranosidase
VRVRTGRKMIGPGILAIFGILGVVSLSASPATIEVDASRVTGEVHPFVFGQFIEHEYNTIEGGLWAELLHDRKFEEGDKDRDGVSDGWVPDERVTNRYWELVEGRGPYVRYLIDHQEFYGGGASQAVELVGSGHRAGIYQIQIQLVKDRRYSFYVYLKRRGTGHAWVEIDRPQGLRYARLEIPVTDQWRKYSLAFTAPEDTKIGRVHVAVEGTGTFWIDSASLLPSDNFHGMRRDVVEALMPLKIPIMRYPGGCFVDGYHWRDGIGDRDRRPERWTTVWHHWEPNDFGIDDYMQLARELGFQPHITVNYGSGTSEEAAQWVEYANGSPQTPMGRLRAQNGHADPYGIKFWAVGNEAAELCAGQYIGSTSVEDYVRRFREYLTRMQAVDSTIRVMSVGVPPGPPNWNRDLLGSIPVDLMAMSIYTGEGERNDLDTRLPNLDYYYRKVVAEPVQVGNKLDELSRDMEDRRPRDHAFMAVTELNSWWLSEKVDSDYRLCNGLYWGAVFNELLRRANLVYLAEFSTTLNVQGLIRINPVTIKLTPPYFAYLLYRNHIGTRVLQTAVASPMTSFNSELAALDAVATLSEDRRQVYLAVVNREENGEIAAPIRIQHWTPQSGRVLELNGKDKNAANQFGATTDVNLRQADLPPWREALTYTFPAHSITILEIVGE